MSALRQSVGDYLALRRSVGYKLKDAARILASFVAFAERSGAGTIPPNWPCAGQPSRSGRADPALWLSV